LGGRASARAAKARANRERAVQGQDANVQIPVTILTGFLGAGKTTLLNRILSESHGRRIAVIENEYGPASVDNDLLIHDGEEQIVELNNGCVCCTVRGDLARALGQLRERRAAGSIEFERVIVETTGMANPGPVAQTFFIDEDVGRSFRIDGVITVVDAMHGHATLDAQPEAQSQVGFADRILLSKTDLVEAETERSLRERLVRMNPRAPIRKVHMGEVPIDEVLDINGFDLDAVLDVDPAFLQGAASHDGHGHAHAPGEDCETCAHGDPDHGNHDHVAAQHGAAAHDDEIQAFLYQSPRPFDLRRLEDRMGMLVQVYGTDMLRYKGVLFVRGSGRRMVLQGVHMMMGVEPGRPWERRETPSSRLVFIGRKLPREIFTQELDSCLIR
jgi:G3E family GTPase